ncbi:MAG: T9SS type A sorting domain-containing protein [Syntrophothermus sp.]
MRKFLLLVLVLSVNSFGQIWQRIDTVFSPSGVLVSSFSATAMGDVTGDGLPDLIVGNGGDKASFYKNMGPRNNPKFAEDPSVLEPIYARGIAFTNADYPDFVDLDADNDLDLVIGGYSGPIYYKNFGDSANPVYAKDSLYLNYLYDQVGTDAKPIFADIDADGDYDLFIGTGESFFGGPPAGLLYAFRNTGTPQAPVFVRDSTLTVGIPDVGLNCYPTFADLNGDGDLDMLLGRDLSTVVYYQNIGTAQVPQWQMQTTLFNVVDKIAYWKNPEFTDFDGDLDYDLLVGTDAGNILYYENTGTVTSPAFTRNTNFFKVIKVDGGATVNFADFDNDGDFDLLAGDWLGNVNYLRNDGTPFVPVYTRVTGAPFSALKVSSYSTPVFVDLDKDNDKDVVTGGMDGQLHYYKNNGTSFTADNSSLFAGIDVVWQSAPAFGDIDNDGDMDLLVGAEEGVNVTFYRSQGDTLFIKDSTTFSSVVFQRNTAPAFVDIDFDGDLDLFFGTLWREFYYYENTGTNTVPVWTRNTTLTSPLVYGQSTHPGFADLDHDGRKDMVFGQYDGNFTYYKNLFATPNDVKNISTTIPKGFSLEQNYPNPFNPSTSIVYHVQTASMVTLKIFDILGNEVAQLVNEFQNPGSYSVNFNASELSSGIYLYQINAGSFTSTKKMMLMK